MSSWSNDGTDAPLRENHGCGETLKETSPSQMIRQIPGCNAMKAFHPALEPTVVGVDVLNVENAFDHTFPIGRMTVR